MPDRVPNIKQLIFQTYAGCRKPVGGGDVSSNPLHSQWFGSYNSATPFSAPSAFFFKFK